MSSILASQVPEPRVVEEGGQTHEVSPLSDEDEEMENVKGEMERMKAIVRNTRPHCTPIHISIPALQLSKLEGERAGFVRDKFAAFVVRAIFMSLKSPD